MADTTNPLIAPSTLPYSLPPFADILDEHYEPAFEHGMREHLDEIRAITENPDAPTFENTMVAIERSGQVLHRVATVFFNKSSADSNAFTNELEERIAPLLAAHEDAIVLDAALYARVQRVAEASRDAGEADHADPADQTDPTDQADHAGHLDDEARYLLERSLAAFEHAGAALDDESKETLRGYNQRLSTLTTRFEKNLLADTNDLAVVVTDVEELDGLGESEIASLAAAAAERGMPDAYLITLVLPTGHPTLASLTSRALRRRIMAASRARGARGGDTDNRELVLEITRLRAERARLLGYNSHAEYVTSAQTAGSPEAVARMLGQLTPAAARNARAEQEALQALVDDTEAEPFAIDAHDWAFYAERVRQATFDVDTAAMRPYFEAERVLRDGVFFAATQLYGVTFTERHDLMAYHPDARVFEVHNDDGSELGLYVLDLYTRDSKRGGAWMNPLVSQSRLLGLPPVVVNNLNVPKPAAGSPALLTLDEVTTLFHEFGHALHGLFADVTYPRFSGTNVFRDFVEFPSQVNEMWMLWPEVLANYAVHHRTGDPMPADLVEKVRASSAFDEGHSTSEYLQAALLDQAWHRLTADDTVADVQGFEADALAEAGLDNPAVPTRYASTYFAHTFSGGYDAGYYSYIWSEVLDADTVDWFAENGGLSRENGDRFRELLLGVGGSRDPLAAYRAFRGRDAVIEPLLVRRGLTA